MIRSEAEFPSIDYEAHPAFRNLEAASTAYDAGLTEAIRKVDAALEELDRSSEYVPPAELEREYRQRAVPEFDAIGRLLAQAIPTELPIAKAAQKAVADTRTDLLKDALYKNGKRLYRGPGRMSAPGERIANELAEKGLSMQRIPDAVIQTISEDLGKYRDDLLEMSSRNGGSHCALALPHSGRYWSELSRFLDRSQLLAGCSQFQREPLEMIYCSFSLSHDGERWWQGCYEDVGISTTRTVYMHNDQAPDVMKAIVYLGEVGENQGPFCFIGGSHRWRRSRTQAYLFKALDHAVSAEFTPREPVKTPYYRKAFRHPELRRQFLRLPRPVRGSSHFGDDVLDDSELSRWLLNQESAITSDMANCIAFIGYDGIHRGGCVPQGKRWALQLGFRKVPPVRQRVARSAKAAYGFAGTKLRRAVRRMIGESGVRSVRSLANRVTGR